MYCRKKIWKDFFILFNQDYLKPLRKKQIKGVDIGSIAQIFSNIEILVEIHSKMSEELHLLTGKDAYNPFFKSIGDIILKYVSLECLLLFLFILFYLGWSITSCLW